VLAAAAVVRRGGDASQAAMAAQLTAQRSNLWFTVDTLDYLRKGGRISPAAAALGNVLGIRPILGIEDGQIVPVDRVRTTPRARADILERGADAVARMEYPAYATVRSDEGVTARGLEKLGGASPAVFAVNSITSSVITVHTGPGSFGVAVADFPAGLF